MAFNQITTAALFTIPGCVIFGITSIVLRQFVPKSVENTKIEKWKWVNYTNSLIHAIIAGSASVLCLYYYTPMRDDLLNYYVHNAECLVCFSFGYFIFDSCDMLIHNRGRSTYELMIHHVYALHNFGIPILTKKFLGFAIVVLTIEIHNIFLHLRQLLILQNFKPQSSTYRLVAVLNAVLYILIRIPVILFMTDWIITNANVIPTYGFWAAGSGLLTMNIINVILLYRILVADFFTTYDTPSSNAVMSNQNGFTSHSSNTDAITNKKIE